LVKLSAIFVLLINGQRGFSVGITEIPQMVKSRNHDVKATATEVEMAEQEIKVARARYLPNIELKSTYTRLDKDVVLDLPNHHVERQILNGSVTIGLDVDPPPVEIQKKDIMMSNLVLTQPIFTGGRISAGMDAAEAGLNAAKAEENAIFKKS
jgi:outer membrane protein TolC